MERVRSGESEKVRESEQTKKNKWGPPRGLATPCTQPLRHHILPSGQKDNGRTAQQARTSSDLNMNMTTSMGKKKWKKKEKLC
jgi:hypothetical protein